MILESFLAFLYSYNGEFSPIPLPDQEVILSIGCREYSRTYKLV